MCKIMQHRKRRKTLWTSKGHCFKHNQQKARQYSSKLRLQAKQQVKELFKEQRSQSNKISAEARAVHTPTNTRVPLEFVSRRLDSWQLHLEEISYYLVEREGVWWKTCGSEGVTFEFLDTENSHEDPKPQHYRAANFSQLKQQKQNAWEKIINSDTTLPTSGIKLYDHDGNFLSTKTFAPYMTMFSTEYGLETNTDTTPTAQEEPTDMPQHNDDEMHTDSASIDEPVPKDTVSDNLPQSVTVEHSAVGKQLAIEDPSEETDTEYPTAPVNLKTKLGKALFQSLQPDPTSKEIEEVDKK